MTERKTFLRGILGTGGLGGCPRRRLGSAVPEYYTVLPQLKDLALVTVPTHNVLNPLWVLHSIMVNQYLLWGVFLLTQLTNRFLQIDDNFLVGGRGVFGDWGGRLLRSLLLCGWCIWTLPGLSFSLVLPAAFLLFP